MTTPFALERGPLARFRLAPPCRGAARLVITAHHAVCDGWSTAVLLNDLAQLYSAAHRRQAERLEAARCLQRLRPRAGRSAETRRTPRPTGWPASRSAPPALDLPADRRRPPLKSYAAARVDTSLPPALVASLRGGGASARARASSRPLLAGFDALLYRLTGQEDIVVGIPAAGQAAAGRSRPRRPLREHAAAARPSSTPTAPSRLLVRSAREAVLEGLRAPGAHLGSLLAHAARCRAIPAACRWPRSCSTSTWPSARPLALRGPRASIRIHPARGRELRPLRQRRGRRRDGRAGERSTTPTSSTRPPCARWLRLLRGAAAAPPRSPGRAVSRLPVPRPPDRAQLAAWNEATVRGPRASACVHELVERAGRSRRPTRSPSPSRGGSSPTASSTGRANQLARRLRARGVGRGALVGLCLERSPELLVALLGVPRRAAAYVPLDPAYPADRLRS